MALTRRLLASMGIDDEKIEQIIQAHAETVTALKDEIDTYKTKAEQLPGALQELNELKSKVGGADEYKTKLEALKAEYDKFKSDVELEKTMSAKKSAYTDVCRDAGLSERGIEKALKYAEWNDIELDESGKIKNAKDHIKGLKTDWAEYVQERKAVGAVTPTPPAGGGNGSPQLSRAAELYQQHYQMLYGQAPGARKGSD